MFNEFSSIGLTLRTMILFVPKASICFWICRLIPSPIANSQTTDAIPINIPNTVSSDRIGWSARLLIPSRQIVPEKKFIPKSHVCRSERAGRYLSWKSMSDLIRELECVNFSTTSCNAASSKNHRVDLSLRKFNFFFLQCHPNRFLFWHKAFNLCFYCLNFIFSF